MNIRFTSDSAFFKTLDIKNKSCEMRKTKISSLKLKGDVVFTFSVRLKRDEVKIQFDLKHLYVVGKTNNYLYHRKYLLSVFNATLNVKCEHREVRNKFYSDLKFDRKP